MGLASLPPFFIHTPIHGDGGLWTAVRAPGSDKWEKEGKSGEGEEGGDWEGMKERGKRREERRTRGQKGRIVSVYST